MSAELERAGEESKWAAAEEYQKASEAGATERQIAEVAGFSQPHIHYMLITTVIKEGNPDFTFADCYAAAQKPRSVGPGGRGWWGGVDCDRRDYTLRFGRLPARRERLHSAIHHPVTARLAGRWPTETQGASLSP